MSSSVKVKSWRLNVFITPTFDPTMEKTFHSLASSCLGVESVTSPNVLKLFTTKLISFLGFAIRIVNVNIYLRVLNLTVLFLSHQSVFTTQFVYVNWQKLSPKKEYTNFYCYCVWRLIFNSFIEINHVNNLNLLAHKHTKRYQTWVHLNISFLFRWGTIESNRVTILQ